MRRIAITLGCLLVFSLAGCQLFSLKPQLATLKSFNFFTGSVRCESGLSLPIYAIAYTGAAGAEQPVMFERVPGPAGIYRLVVPTGEYSTVHADADQKYHVLAFEDANNDGIYNAGERYAIFQGDLKNSLGNETEERQANIVIPAIAPPADGMPHVAGENLRVLTDRRAGRQGKVVALDDPIFDDAHVVEGIYRPIEFFKNYGPTIYFLEPYDPKRTPVIFVHGMNGSPRNWKEILAALDHSRFQPWIYYWPSGMPARLSAWQLSQCLDDLRWRYQFTDCKLVAHSMGGLVSRAALNLRAKEGRPMLVTDFITLSTPWDGDPKAPTGVKMSPVVVPSWRDMCREGPFLTDLFKQDWPETVRYTLFFTYGGGKPNEAVDNDGVITIRSMLRPEAQARANYIYGFDDEHTAVLADPLAVKMVNKRLTATDAR